jgi:hypothetical protein
MNKYLFDTTAKLSTEELVNVLISDGDYQEMAVNFAKDELARRRVPEAELSAMFHVQRARREDRLSKAKEGLSLKWKAVYLLFPVVMPLYSLLPFIMRFFLPHPPSMIYWHENGYYQKSSQAGWFSFFGIVLWVVVFIVCVFIFL